MPKLHGIRIPKAAELVASELRRRIVSGDLQAGDHLPPERQLVERFQVATTTVREALRILEAEGLVTIRRGPSGGGEVREPDPRTLARYASLLLQYEGATVEDVYRARVVIEPAAVASLVDRSDRVTVAGQLEAALASEDAARGDAEELARWEGYFHQLVMSFVESETLALLCSVSNAIVARHVSRFFERRRRSANEIGPGFEAAHRAHTRLVDLVASGSRAEVEFLWKRHLEEASISLGPLGRMSVFDLMN
jgi:GntR family transcriptional regulator, transcriptional repressor for pyruvate dehydrogenase complex